jgi:tRNA threonylcarbamoyl adenosine modification protein (Sua5/YciO/YrdC/YwlC family)
MYLKINPNNPQPRQVDTVAQLLRQGGVIAYPTDTCYGLGCDIMNKKAIERVYQIKQLDKRQPFSFICSDLTNISQYAKVTNYAYKTMKRLLPGPYTFILDGSKLVPKIMLTKRRTAGIRVPNHPICLQIIQKLGNPIISTSITRPDHTMINEPFLIEEFLGRRIDAVIDGGPVPGQPSSVISLIDDEPEVLRVGLGDVEEFL